MMMKSLLKQCTGLEVSVIISGLGNYHSVDIIWDYNVPRLGKDIVGELLQWSLLNMNPLRLVEAVYQVGDVQVGMAKNYRNPCSLAHQVAVDSLEYIEDSRRFNYHHVPETQIRFEFLKTSNFIHCSGPR